MQVVALNVSTTIEWKILQLARLLLTSYTAMIRHILLYKCSFLLGISLIMLCCIAHKFHLLKYYAHVKDVLLLYIFY